jgi:hypothetical protein
LWISWIVTQGVLLNGYNKTNIYNIEENHIKYNDIAKIICEKYADIPLLGEEILKDLLQSIKNEIDKTITELSPDDRAALFLDLLKCYGYQIGEHIPDSSTDAYDLVSDLPLHIHQTGFALLLSNKQHYDFITHKMLTDQYKSDFIIVFVPTLLHTSQYFDRETIDDKGMQLRTPSVRLIGIEDISHKLLTDTLELLYDEYAMTISGLPNYKNIIWEFKESNKLE